MTGKLTYDHEQDITKLKNKKEEINSLIESYQEEKIDLIKQVHKLEQELHKVKRRYKKEQQLKNRSKKDLDNIHKSRSWRFSFPVRKVGSIIKKPTNKKGQPYANVKKETVTNHMSARDLDRKLWAGYSQYALKELNKLKHSQDAPLNERLRATRSLARWYYDKQDYEKAYTELEYINETKPLNHPNPDRVITEIKVLKKLHETKAAKRKVWDTINARGLLPELCLSMAYLAKGQQEKLNWYNLIYDMYGLNKVRKLDPTKPFSLENICTTPSRIDRSLEQYKISIIIPAYNAEDSIHIPLKSLLNQTFQNIEIIIVDDCSPDNTVEVIESFAKKDHRIKLIQKKQNEGAYAARNTALQYITGDFVTIHDSDDWSHSQKLEIQLRELLKNSEAVGSISYLSRVSEDITPINAGSLLGSKFLIMNSSSLLIRKSVIKEIGGWDSVRVAGDSEFIWRIEKIFGKDSIVRVLPTVPLSLALSNESSLTGSSTTHVKTIMFGLRRSYREAFEWWHNQTESSKELYLDPSKMNRKFPCPLPNQIRNPQSRFYDIIFIADFSDQSNVNKIIKGIESSMAEKDKAAIFHWPDYKGNPYKKIANRVFSKIDQEKIDILVPNEDIEAEKVICLTSRILDYEIDQAPNIVSKQAFIIEDEPISEETKMIREENFKEVFKTEAKWLTE